MFATRDGLSGDLKYTSRSKAQVIDNRDPLKKGRIRVRHPLVGETTWIPYIKAPNSFDVPNIGDIVLLEADAGHHTHTLAHGNIVTGKDDSPNIPEEFQRDIPTNRGLYTPNGHLLELDDGIANLSNAPVDNNLTTENRGVRLTTSAGNKIWISEDPSSNNQNIKIQDISGNIIQLDYSGNTPFITIQSNGTMDISIKQNWSETIQGNKQETINGGLTINVTGNVGVVSNGTVIVSGNTKVQLESNTEIDLGSSATEAIIKGNAFQSYFNGHTHPTGVGPSGPPISPMPGSNLSTKVKTE